MAEAIDASTALSGLLSSPNIVRSCALRPDGMVECWGSDGSSPVAEGVFVSISVGRRYGCGLRLSGEVDCWGDSNLYGEMDAPDGTFTAVRAALRRTCGLRRDGSAQCWGGGQELPTGVTPIAPDVEFPGIRFTDISVGRGHVCGLRPDGEAACWGTNWFGQAAPPPGPFAAIDAGVSHSCGLRPDGSVVCWGEDSLDAAKLMTVGFMFGGDETAYLADRRDTEEWVLYPETDVFMDLEGAVPESELREEMARHAATWEPPEGPFIAVSAGSGFTCGLRVDGEVECWGYFAREEPRIPLQVYSEVYGERLRDFHDITTASAEAGVAFFDPRFYPLYESLYGARVWELDPAEYLIVAPGVFSIDSIIANIELVDPPPGPFIAVEAGTWRACGLRPDGEIDCWGLDGEHSTPPPGPFATTPISATAAP